MKRLPSGAASYQIDLVEDQEADSFPLSPDGTVERSYRTDADEYSIGAFGWRYGFDVSWREETVVNYRTVTWVGIAFLVLWALTVLRQATAPTERG